RARSLSARSLHLLPAHSPLPDAHDVRRPGLEYDLHAEGALEYPDTSADAAKRWNIFRMRPGTRKESVVHFRIARRGHSARLQALPQSPAARGRNRPPSGFLPKTTASHGLGHGCPHADEPR